MLLMKTSDEYGSATNCLIIRQPVMAAVFLSVCPGLLMCILTCINNTGRTSL